MSFDFSKYDKEQLEEFLKVINPEKHPERVKAIRKRLNVINALELAQQKQSESLKSKKSAVKSFWSSWTLVTMGALFCFYVAATGEIPIRFSQPITVAESPIEFYVTLFSFICITLYFLKIAYSEKVKRERA